MERLVAVGARAIGIEDQPELFPTVPLDMFVGFLVLGGYYLISPLSDNLNALLDNKWLPVISVVTLVITVILGQLYQLLVAHAGQDRVLPIVFHILVAGLVMLTVLYALDFTSELRDADHDNKKLDDTGLIVVAIAFSIYTAVFSLYSQLTFWALMARLHTRDEARLLFPAIAGGMQIGNAVMSALADSAFSAMHYYTLLLTAGFYELAVPLVLWRQRLRPPPHRAEAEASVQGGGAIAGGDDGLTDRGSGGGGGNGEGSRASHSSVTVWETSVVQPLRLLLSTPMLRLLSVQAYVYTFMTGESCMLALRQPDLCQQHPCAPIPPTPQLTPARCARDARVMRA